MEATGRPRGHRTASLPRSRAPPAVSCVPTWVAVLLGWPTRRAPLRPEQRKATEVVTAERDRCSARAGEECGAKAEAAETEAHRSSARRWRPRHTARPRRADRRPGRARLRRSAALPRPAGEAPGFTRPGLEVPAKPSWRKRSGGPIRPAADAAKDLVNRLVFLKIALETSDKTHQPGRWEERRPQHRRGRLFVGAAMHKCPSPG